MNSLGAKNGPNWLVYTQKINLIEKKSLVKNLWCLAPLTEINDEHVQNKI